MEVMKTLTLALACSLSTLALTPAFASPIAADLVPNSAKWVAHLDVDQLQRSRLGEKLVRQFIDPQLGALADQVHTFLGVDLDWHKIHGITAYGTNIKKKPDAHTVLLVNSELPLKDLLSAARKTFATAQPGSPALLRSIPQENGEIIAVGQEAYLAIGKGNLLVIGKAERSVSNAVATLQGRGKPLTSERAWVGRSSQNSSFLTIGLTEGFHEGLQLPPQAQALKMTDGAQLTVGEVADDVVARFSLKAKESSVVESLQQALQGVVALATLGTAQQPDLQALVQGVKVEKQEKEVDLALRYPIAEVMKWVEGKKPTRSAQR